MSANHTYIFDIESARPSICLVSENIVFVIFTISALFISAILLFVILFIAYLFRLFNFYIHFGDFFLLVFGTQYKTHCFLKFQSCKVFHGKSISKTNNCVLFASFLPLIEVESLGILAVDLFRYMSGKVICGDFPGRYFLETLRLKISGRTGDSSDIPVMFRFWFGVYPISR